MEPLHFDAASDSAGQDAGYSSGDVDTDPYGSSLCETSWIRISMKDPDPGGKKPSIISQKKSTTLKKKKFKF